MMNPSSFSFIKVIHLDWMQHFNGIFVVCNFFSIRPKCRGFSYVKPDSLTLVGFGIKTIKLACKVVTFEEGLPIPGMVNKFYFLTSARHFSIKVELGSIGQVLSGIILILVSLLICKFGGQVLVWYEHLRKKPAQLSQLINR